MLQQPKDIKAGGTLAHQRGLSSIQKEQRYPAGEFGTLFA